MIPEPESTLATFTESLQLVSIISGTESKWTLPDIDPGNIVLSEVRLDADPLISQYLKYDSATNEVRYDGKEISGLSGVKLVNIRLALVNSFGENPFTQLVTVSPEPDQPSTPVTLEEENPTIEKPTQEAVVTETGEGEGETENSNLAPETSR